MVEGKVGMIGIWIVSARSPIVRVSIGRAVVIAVVPWVCFFVEFVSLDSLRDRLAIDGGMIRV